MSDISSFILEYPRIQGIPVLSDNVMRRYWCSSHFPKERPAQGYAAALDALFHVRDPDELDPTIHPQYRNTQYNADANGIALSWWDLPDMLSPKELLGAAMNAFSALSAAVDRINERDQAGLAPESIHVSYAWGDAPLRASFDPCAFHAFFEQYGRRHGWRESDYDTMWRYWLNSAYPPLTAELELSDCPTPYRMDQLAWARTLSFTASRPDQLHALGALVAKHPELLAEMNAYWSRALSCLDEYQNAIVQCGDIFQLQGLDKTDLDPSMNAIDEVLNALVKRIDCSGSKPFEILAFLHGYATTCDRYTVQTVEVLQHLLVYSYLREGRDPGFTGVRCFDTKLRIEYDPRIQYLQASCPDWSVIVHPISRSIFWNKFFESMSQSSLGGVSLLAGQLSRLVLQGTTPSVDPALFYHFLEDSFSIFKSRKPANTPKLGSIETAAEWFFLIQGYRLGIIPKEHVQDRFLSFIQHYLSRDIDIPRSLVDGFSSFFDVALPFMYHRDWSDPEDVCAHFDTYVREFCVSDNALSNPLLEVVQAKTDVQSYFRLVSYVLQASSVSLSSIPLESDTYGDPVL